MSLIEKVLARDPLLRGKLQPSGDCLVWTGSATNGKGVVVRDGIRLLVRRYVYELAYDEIVPSYTRVKLSCQTKLCADPEHMSV